MLGSLERGWQRKQDAWVTREALGVPFGVLGHGCLGVWVSLGRGVGIRVPVSPMESGGLLAAPVPYW